jgi:hypothetical protein
LTPGQVEEYLGVYREKGGQYLQTYRTPTLSWDEVKAMKGAGTTGLGLGFNAPGEGHLQVRHPLIDAMQWTHPHTQ